jgi:NTP pyrophosphatase (non-canonical NTP hydrolase)
MTARYANGFEAMKGDRVRRIAIAQSSVPIGSEWTVEKIIGWMIVVDCGAWDARNFNLIARADGSLPGEVDITKMVTETAEKVRRSGRPIHVSQCDPALAKRAMELISESRDAAARDKLTGDWYSAEVERVAKERDEAREALKRITAMCRVASNASDPEQAVADLVAQWNASSDKATYIDQIRRAAAHIAKVLGDDIGHCSPIEMATHELCVRYGKARDALDAISQSQADAYDEFVQSRKSQASVLPTQEATDALHGSIGIITEGGELLDAMKKHLYYGRDFDRVNAIKELGDIEFYASVLRHSLGVTRDEVLRVNVAKLERRYKERFTATESVNRDVKAERGIMEHELQDLKGGE